MGTGASDYFLYVGTTQGANNIFAKDEGLAASQVVNGLPNEHFGCAYRHHWFHLVDQQLQLHGNSRGTSPATMTIPANHATLSNPTVTFNWTTGSGASDYFLYVGTTQGANNILGKDEGLATSQGVNGLPNGTIWVRLWTLIGSTWWINDYSYTENGGSGTPAVITSPANHSDLFGGSITLPVGKRKWCFGLFPVCRHDPRGQQHPRQRRGAGHEGQVVNGLPNGTIWVRVWTLIGSTWWANDYSYTDFLVGDDYPWKSTTADSVNSDRPNFYIRECTDFVAMANEPGQGRHVPIHVLVQEHDSGPERHWGKRYQLDEPRQAIGYRSTRLRHRRRRY